jgi:hypothetical protein
MQQDVRTQDALRLSAVHQDRAREQQGGLLTAVRLSNICHERLGDEQAAAS